MIQYLCCMRNRLDGGLDGVAEKRGGLPKAGASASLREQVAQPEAHRGRTYPETSGEGVDGFFLVYVERFIVKCFCQKMSGHEYFRGKQVGLDLYSAYSRR